MEQLWIVVVALVGLTGALLWVARAISMKIDYIEPERALIDPTPVLEILERKIAQNRDAIAHLVVAVSDGIAHTSRHEKRISKQVTGARRLLKENGLEHAGLEAEYAEIRDNDAEPSEEEGVLPLRAPVEEVERDSGIPGLSNADIEHLKEIGAF